MTVVPSPAVPAGNADLDVAIAIADHHHHHLRYLTDTKQWWAFRPDEGKWVVFDDARMQTIAIAFGKTSAKAMANAVAAARGLPELQASVHDFNTHPWLFNVRNGTLNLDPAPELIEHEPGQFFEATPEAWEFLEHSPVHLLSQVAGCEFVPFARAPRWETFLSEILPDPEVRAFLQRLIGYALVGNQTEAIFPVLWGKGANGKSTFVDVLYRLFGDYACVAEKSLFKAVRNDGHPADRAVLINKRLAVSEELPDVELDEPKIKGLTGGDRISGRGMRENFKEWDPTHTFLVHSNTEPRFSGTDDGIWRRLVLIPFGVRIPVEQADPYLKPKLYKELPGILNWALRGYEAYCTGGLAVPAVLRRVVDEYRSDSDTVSTFVDRYEFSPGDVAWAVVFEHKEYATESGLSPEDARKNFRAVTARFREMGAVSKAAYNAATGKTQRGWVGLRPRP